MASVESACHSTPQSACQGSGTAVRQAPWAGALHFFFGLTRLLEAGALHFFMAGKMERSNLQEPSWRCYALSATFLLSLS